MMSHSFDCLLLAWCVSLKGAIGSKVYTEYTGRRRFFDSLVRQQSNPQPTVEARCPNLLSSSLCMYGVWCMVEQFNPSSKRIYNY